MIPGVITTCRNFKANALRLISVLPTPNDLHVLAALLDISETGQSAFVQRSFSDIHLRWHTKI